jgi:hypothetical protein
MSFVKVSFRPGSKPWQKSDDGNNKIFHRFPDSNSNKSIRVSYYVNVVAEEGVRRTMT